MAPHTNGIGGVGSMGWRRKSQIGLCAIGVAAALLLPGCGQVRSAEAFCDVMDKHKERYLASWDDAYEGFDEGTMEGFLAGLATGMGAIGDLRQMWDELADVAPEEIRADVEVIRDSYAAQLDSSGDAVTDPLGAFGSALMHGLLTGSSWNRVDTFTVENCG